MKFLVLCVVAFFAPNLIDNGDTYDAIPRLSAPEPLPPEKAPIAGPAEPGDPDQRRVFKRRPPRSKDPSARFRSWIQDRRDARLKRTEARARKRLRDRDGHQDVNGRTSHLDRQPADACTPLRRQGPDPRPTA